MKEYGRIDSKFRFVILASKRAKELLKGAKPKVKSRSKNLIRVAQEEVEKGLIDFEIVENKLDEIQEGGDDIFIGEELVDTPEVADEEIKEAKGIEPSEDKAESKKKAKKK